jgi:hypothetical protein
LRQDRKYTQQQTWLVTAAIGNEQTARKAWTQWETSVGDWSEAHIDPGSFRLLPSVYKNLKTQKIETDSLARLRGIYKKASIKNMLLFERINRELQVLKNENIPILVFKGGNLAVNYYRDRGARPMSDFDILVPQEYALPALKAFIGNGWHAIYEKSPESVIEFRKSIDLIHPSGAMLDLHRRFLTENQLSSDERVWQRALSSNLDGLPILVPSVEDELILACIHGWHWNSIPSFRWIVDANMLLRGAENTFDWSYFVAETRRRKVSYRAWLALCLIKEMDLSIPEKVLLEIGNGPFESFEEAEEVRVSKPMGFLPRAMFISGYAHIRENGYPRGPRALLTLIQYVLQDRRMPTDLSLVVWWVEKLWNGIKRQFNLESI